MTDFTRVTVVGERRRAEIVVASDEPFAGLVPRFLDLLGEEPDASRAPALVRATGQEIDLAADSRAQSVLDGEVLRLLRRADAPPPPEVSDVTDAVADEFATSARPWNVVARQGVGMAGIAGATLAAGLLLGELRLPPAAAVAVPLVAAAVLAALGAALGRRWRWPALAVTAAALGLSADVGAAASALFSPHAAPSAPLAVALAVLWAWIAAGVGAGIGLRHRPLLTAAAVGGAHALIAAALLAIGAPLLGTCGVVAVLATVSCGVLPAWAMSASGLTGLDDAVARGTPAPRTRVRATLGETYATLDWTVGAIALTLAACTTVLLAGADGWSAALGAAAVVVCALRTRAFPGATQGVLLWGAAGVPAIVGIGAHAAQGWGAAALSGLALGIALLVGVRPAPHQRARLRAFGNAVEAVAVVAMLPLLLGSFDLYEHLLGTF